jgi:hypothetical protein
MTTREDMERDYLMQCWRDPRKFARLFCRAQPTADQDAMLEAIRHEGAHVTVRSGHGIGKSSVMAWTVLWFLLFHKDCKVACTAPTQAQLRDVLWPEIAKWHARMPKKFQQEIVVLKNSVVHAFEPQTRFAVARTARKDKPEALQGIRATNTLYLVDEASGVDEAVFVVAESALTQASARVLLAGNPTRSEGYFYDTHRKPGVCEHWQRLHFSSANSSLVDKAFVARMAKYGLTSLRYKVRVLGEFPDVSADILIPIHLLERACVSATKPAGERVAGLDIARFGDDRSALIIRQGPSVTAIHVWAGYDTMTTAKRALALAGLYDVICVDEIGVGGGVVDLLRSTGKVRVVPVNVSCSSTDPQFARLRDQLWFACRDWLANEDEHAYILAHPQREDLIDELSKIKFGYYQGSDRLKVESKDDMKQRLGHSPDIADALCMTFAVPYSSRGGSLGLYHTARSMGAIFSPHSDTISETINLNTDESDPLR